MIGRSHHLFSLGSAVGAGKLSFFAQKRPFHMSPARYARLHTLHHNQVTFLASECKSQSLVLPPPLLSFFFNFFFGYLFWEISEMDERQMEFGVSWWMGVEKVV